MTEWPATIDRRYHDAVILGLDSVIFETGPGTVEIRESTIPLLRRLQDVGVATAISLRALPPRRAEIGAYVSDVVRRWDSQTLVDKLELSVGRDLQFIRINGTLVGGLVGLLIFALSRAVESF